MGDLPGHGKQINAFATSCYRVMLNIKHIDHVLNTTVYSMTNNVPLIHLVRHCQLKFLGHILCMSKEEPARRYALYIPNIGKRRSGLPCNSYLYLCTKIAWGQWRSNTRMFSRLPHLLMIVMHEETLWSPALSRWMMVCAWGQFHKTWKSILKSNSTLTLFKLWGFSWFWK